MNLFGELPQRTLLDFKLLRTKKTESLTVTKTSLVNDSGEAELNLGGLHKAVEGTVRMYEIRSRTVQ